MTLNLMVQKSRINSTETVKHVHSIRPHKRCFRETTECPTIQLVQLHAILHFLEREGEIMKERESKVVFSRVV